MPRDPSLISCLRIGEDNTRAEVQIIAERTAAPNLLVVQSDKCNARGNGGD